MVTLRTLQICSKDFQHKLWKCSCVNCSYTRTQPNTKKENSKLSNLAEVAGQEWKLEYEGKQLKEKTGYTFSFIEE